MSRRRTTVYDFSGLNLHPDGSRATAPYRPRGSRAHLDRRGNWVVEDPARIPKSYVQREVVIDDENEPEEFDFTGVDLTHTTTPPTSAKGKERERTPEAGPPARSAKRRKINHDFSFLDTSLPSAATAPSPSSAFAVPSSDLLKCIHHFACNYYSDRGQLFNASRTYRKWKRRRRLERLALKEKAQEEAQDEDANSGDEEGPPENGVDPPERIFFGGRRRDMYKTMDGSALLAIGMLLQEHVSRMLSPRIPDGWEQSMLDYSANEDEEVEVEEVDLDEAEKAGEDGDEEDDDHEDDIEDHEEDSGSGEDLDDKAEESNPRETRSDSDSGEDYTSD
ncbi:hypothetical protein DFH09DRAFT_182353 [Mycena vulgaris]|nr:hypothetical protein DFH09DRAFT_182353 [Mycena vulgaris]